MVINYNIQEKENKQDPSIQHHTFFDIQKEYFKFLWHAAAATDNTIITFRLSY